VYRVQIANIRDLVFQGGQGAIQRQRRVAGGGFLGSLQRPAQIAFSGLQIGELVLKCPNGSEISTVSERLKSDRNIALGKTWSALRT